MTKEGQAAIALVVLGVAQMAADLGGLSTLKGIAAATGASPAPRVFSAVRGLETYSTRFRIEWTGPDGPGSLTLTPEVAARLRGPYNRRNVYGAALAFGPVLASDPRTKPMLDAVVKHALSGERPLLRELGVDVSKVTTGVRVVYEPLAPTELPLTVIEVP